MSAKVLSQLISDPGVYSEVSISPALASVNPSTDIVAIIGDGVKYKKVSKNLPNAVNSGNEYFYDMGVNFFASDVGYMAIMGTSDFTTSELVANTNYKLKLKLYKKDTNTWELAEFTYTSGATAPALGEFIDNFNNITSIPVYMIQYGNKVLIYLKPSSGYFSFVVEPSNLSPGEKDIKTIASLPNSPTHIYYNGTTALPSDQSYPVYYYKEASEYNSPVFVSSTEMAKAIDYFGPFKFSSVIRSFWAARENGASYFYLIQTNPDNQNLIEPEIESALRSLEPYKCDIVCPAYPIENTSILNKYFAHVKTCADIAVRKERIVVLGVKEISGRLPLNTLESYMSFFDNLSNSDREFVRRIVLIAPGYAKYTYNDGVSSSMYDLDGSYIAAAFSGRLCSMDAASDMTRKSLAAIDSLPLAPSYTIEDKKELMSKSFTFVDEENGLIYVRRASTCDGTNKAAQTIPVVRSIDKLVADIRTGVERVYVGQKITPLLPSSVKLYVQTILNTYVFNGLINGSRGLSVVVNSADPRQIDISFEVQPVFSMLWAYLNVNITL